MMSVRIIGACCMAGLVAACSDSDSGAYVGYVEAEYVYVAAPQAGWLVSAPRREGDRVETGDVLFELDAEQQAAMLTEAEARAAQADAQMRDVGAGAREPEIQALEAQLAEARARLVEARSERDRWMPLVREGNASKARGDQVTANYSSAMARVKAAEEEITVAKLGGRDAAQEAAAAAAAAAKAGQAQAEWVLSQRRVTAKISGQIEDVYHREGEFVSAGRPVVSILPPSALKVRFFAPQEDLPLYAVGDEIEVNADGLLAPVTATISYIATEAEFTPPVIYSVGSREKLVFMIEARLGEDINLRPGLPVDVTPRRSGS